MMRIAYPHRTTREDARRRVDEEAARMLAQSKGQVTKSSYGWTGDTMDFSASGMGATVKGTLTVTDTEVVVDAAVPLFLRAFEGRAKSRILDAFRQMFG
jgi:hypothetical protein